MSTTISASEWRPEMWPKLIESAHKAGLAAVVALTVTPMTVVQHADQFNDSSPVVKSYHVEGGVCGFAWVNIKPSTSTFAKCLVKNGHARKDYGGVTVWVSEFGQSMQ